MESRDHRNKQVEVGWKDLLALYFFIIFLFICYTPIGDGCSNEIAAIIPGTVIDP